MKEMFLPEGSPVVVVSTDASEDSVVVAGADWTPDEFAGFQIAVRSGVGVNQVRTVVSNTEDRLVVSPPWTTPPISSALIISTPSAARTAVSDWDVPRQQLNGLIPADNGVGVVG